VIATIINSAGVLLGAIIGLVAARHIKEHIKSTIFTAAGMMSLIIGILMAIKTQRVLFLALSLVAGGLFGTMLRIEDRILSLGESIKKLLPRQQGDNHSFARGFLESSVLFCVGSMAILGSLNAGAHGDYSLLLTKTVMDSFVAILLAASLGMGVAFSSVSILLYQGAITLLATTVAPYMSPLLISSISGTGGAMVMMIGLNLMGLTRIPTGNYLMSLVLAVAFVLADPYLPAILRS